MTAERKALAFYTDDRVVVKKDATSIRHNLRGRKGVVKRWVCDNMYVVQIDNREYFLQERELDPTQPRIENEQPTS